MINRKTKIFRDTVHGYISVPEEYVSAFIDTDVFQRLRNIEQTGMRVLYPSARHDRFIHSLGTFYLGNKAINCLRNNLRSDYDDGKTDYYSVYDSDKENDQFWNKYQMLFEISCLLHDCGHTPFSHTMEFIYDMKIDGELTLTEKLAACFNTEFKTDITKTKSAPHERMSALLVCTYYKSAISELLRKNFANPESIDSSLEFIARAITGCKYSNNVEKSSKILNCLIELLNSDTIDVDSLDYIIRDSQSSGVNNVSIDTDRLLSSLTIIPITSFNRANIKNFNFSSNVINFSLSNDNNNKCSFIGRCSGSFTAEYFTCSILGEINVKGQMRNKNSPTIKFSSVSNDIISVNGTEYHSIPENIGNESTIEIRGLISNEALELLGSEIDGKNVNGSVTIKSETIEFNQAYIEGTVNGLLTGTIVGDYSDRIKKCTLNYTLGYNKNSLSVIENVLIARNYEYQWIYTHHKVVYYSNYLLIDIFEKCMELISRLDSCENTSSVDCLNKTLSWRRMINELYSSTQGMSSEKDLIDLPPRPTDSDIISLFSHCRLLCNKFDNTDNLRILLDEFFTRKYKVSLWKSFAEYNLFLSDFSDSEKEALFRVIKDNSVCNCGKYGYLNSEWSKKFHEFGFDNVVWVEAVNKIKKFDSDKIYIAFQNRVLTFRTATSASTNQNIEHHNFFYIYYVPAELDHEELSVSKLTVFLKTEIQKLTTHSQMENQ